jgi:hypothetical protein
MSTDNLYIVKRTYTDNKDPNSNQFKVAIKGTYTDLRAAKAAAKHVLVDEGYAPDNFSSYDVNDGSLRPWPHGDGVMVLAVTESETGTAAERFVVELETVPNAMSAEAPPPGSEGGGCRVPGKLFHVLQTDVDYNADRSGDARSTHVEGSFRARGQARDCALAALLDGGALRPSNFAEYDVYDDGTESPFGADVLVHAANENGQNFLVSVVEE